MNWDQIRDNWDVVQDKFHSKWNRLTHDDLTQIDGHKYELVKRLQKRYAYDPKRAEREAENFIKGID